jgi:lysophospholipase L1-like esterase
MRVFARRYLRLLALLVFGVSSAVAVPAADPDPNRFTEQIQSFDEWDSKNAVPAEPVLFVGSSSIRLWRTRESFPDMPVINRGFGGSHISDVIHFAERIVLPYRPEVIVFYAGDNDVAGGKSPLRVFGDYCRFVALVHAAMPETRLVFITIKPSGRRWSLWPEMKKANDLIRSFSQGNERLFFADLATPLLGDDGRPLDRLFLDDRLHLNAQGYAAWTRALRPVLESALGRREQAPAGP